MQMIITGLNIMFYIGFFMMIFGGGIIFSNQMVMRDMRRDYPEESIVKEELNVRWGVWSFFVPGCVLMILYYIFQSFMP